MKPAQPLILSILITIEMPESHTDALELPFSSPLLLTITAYPLLSCPLISATLVGYLTEVAGYLSNFDPDGNVRPFFGCNQGLLAVAILCPWLSKYTAGVWRGCGCICVCLHV